MSDTTRWTRRPAGSNWGDFGPDDELGRINLLSAARVKAAVAEVREGKTFCLSLPLDYPGGSVLSPRRRPPRLMPSRSGDASYFNLPLATLDGRSTDVICDDSVVMDLQYSTQWDSLAHVGALFDADDDGKPEVVYYNGFRGGIDVIGPAGHDESHAHADAHIGARRLGIETLAVSCVQGRGVMIDLFAHWGRERKWVGYGDLMKVMETDGVTVEEGDLLCLRTGFDRVLLEQGKAPDKHVVQHSCAVLDGRDGALLNWITDSGIAALIADNYAVEGYPARENPGGSCAALPLHEHCLFKLGMPLGELFHLSELADWLRTHERCRFLLTAPPLRLVGAVGSPVTPVATV